MKRVYRIFILVALCVIVLCSQNSVSAESGIETKVKLLNITSFDVINYIGYAFGELEMDKDGKI